jgi:uncharacterized protein YecT (DUF1311 family)
LSFDIHIRTIADISASGHHGTMTVLIAQALGLLLAAAPAASTAPTAAEAYSQCLDSSSTNPEWADCGATYLKRLDDELNAAWKKASGSLDALSRKKLLEEQRAWLIFRDSSCQLWIDGNGREGQVLHFYGCRGAIIEARVRDLNGLYGLMHQDEE